MRTFDITEKGRLVLNDSNESPEVRLVVAVVERGVDCTEEQLELLLSQIDEHFHGDLVAAFETVKSGKLEFELTTAGDRWRILRARVKY